MSKLIETAAQKIRRQQAESLNALHTVTCSCSAEWECKKITPQFWVQSGILPSDLAGKMLEAQQATGNDLEKMAKVMNAVDVARSIEFVAKMVRATAVNPRIVEKVEDPSMELSQEEVSACCFETLRDWQSTGGGEAAGLNTFPAGH